MTWRQLDERLAAAPGTTSAYVGRPHAPAAYTRLAEVTHYAASTMKIGVLAALFRAQEAGAVALDDPVRVSNDFASAAPGAPPFGCERRHDNDDVVWERLGQRATLRWLAERMIVRSSNLATNIVISHVGLAEVDEVWQVVGARGSVTARGIEDHHAREIGITNLVTAADLAALLGAITDGAEHSGPLATPASCAAMLEIMLAQEMREDLAAGLPPGTRIAHKNGWVRGVRHGAGVVFPADAPPYVVAVCTGVDPPVSGDREGQDDDERARGVLAAVATASWARRHHLPPAS